MNYKAKIFRIIDANINRAKEGLRVCEDIMRLLISDKDKTLKLKKIRHEISKILKNSMIREFDVIKYRNSKSDIGRKVKLKDYKKSIIDIFITNSQRTKEALRVLEELFTIFDKTASKNFQNLRFKFYNVEKECVKKIGYLCDIR